MSQRARQQQAARARTRRTAGVGVGAVVLLVAAAFLVFGVMLGSDDDAGGDGASSGTVRVSMTEFAFDPDPIVLALGDGAQLEVVNDGMVAHDLVVGQLGKGTPDLPPGESMVLDLSDQPAGTYRVVCDLPGHTEAGMVTELELR
jgi:plastocyanin